MRTRGPSRSRAAGEGRGLPKTRDPGPWPLHLPAAQPVGAEWGGAHAQWHSPTLPSTATLEGPRGRGTKAHPLPRPPNSPRPHLGQTELKHPRRGRGPGGPVWRGGGRAFWGHFSRASVAPGPLDSPLPGLATAESDCRVSLGAPGSLGGAERLSWGGADLSGRAHCELGGARGLGCVRSRSRYVCFLFRVPGNSVFFLPRALDVRFGLRGC